MNEMKQLMTELTDRLRKTNEYNQYINVLSRLKQDPSFMRESEITDDEVYGSRCRRERLLFRE